MFKYEEQMPTHWHDNLSWDNNAPVTLRHFYAILQALAERNALCHGLTNYDIEGGFDSYRNSLYPYRPKSWQAVSSACFWLYERILDTARNPLSNTANFLVKKRSGSEGDGCITATLLQHGYWYFPILDTYEDPVTKRFHFGHEFLSFPSFWGKLVTSYVASNINISALVDVGKGDTVSAKNHALMTFLNQCSDFVSQIQSAFIPELTLDYSSGTHHATSSVGRFITTTSEISSRTNSISNGEYTPETIYSERCFWEDRDFGTFSYMADRAVDGIYYTHKGILNAQLSVHYWQNYSASEEQFVRLSGVPLLYTRGWNIFDEELSHNSNITIVDGDIWGNPSSDGFLRTYLDINTKNISDSSLSCGIDAIKLDYFNVENGFRF